MKRTLSTGQVTTSAELPHDSSTPGELPAEQTPSEPVLTNRAGTNSPMEIVGEPTTSPIPTGQHTAPEKAIVLPAQAHQLLQIIH